MSETDVITGGCGFIGSHLAEYLVSLGRRVRIIDRKPWPYTHHPHITHSICDVRHPNLIDAKAFDGAENVYHLAALADIVPSIENPDLYIQTNVNGTLNVLQLARKYKCRKFIYAASSSCYGIPSVYPTSEYTACKPEYPYALSKYMGEQVALHWASVYGMDVCSLRLFNVYGLRARTHGAYGAVFGVFLAQLANGKPLTVVGDGTQRRDFVHVSDVVRAFAIASFASRRGDVFNIGSSDPVSINRIVELMGSPPVVNVPKRPGEPNLTYADITFAVDRMGWGPTVPIEEGVAELLKNKDAYVAAPVWDEESIKEATQSWFGCLGRKDQ